MISPKFDPAEGLLVALVAGEVHEMPVSCDMIILSSFGTDRGVLVLMFERSSSFDVERDFLVFLGVEVLSVLRFLGLGFVLASSFLIGLS